MLLARAQALPRANEPPPPAPPGKGAPPLLDQPLEAVQVELLGLETQAVAGGAALEEPGGSAGGPVRLEQLTQLRDVDLKRLGGGRRRPLAPKLVDQARTGERFVRVQQEEREQGPLLRAAHR